MKTIMASATKAKFQAPYITLGLSDSN